MSTLTIRKKSLKTWLHSDSILGDFIISKFYFNADNVSFQIVEQGQSKRVIYNITDITLYALPTGGTAETFTTITELSLRLEELNYPAFQYDGQITSIANLIDAGTGVTITGDGTAESPYIINSIGGAGSLFALPFTTNHISANGNQYTIGDVVYYSGNVYRCIAANDSILPTNTLYWTNLGVGYPLVQEPTDWNATSGNNQILNKPTIGTTPTLQEVTDEGADAYGNTINLKNSISSDSLIQFNVDDAFEPYIKVENAALGSGGYFTRIGSNNIEFDGNGDFNTILLPGGNTNVINLPSESGTLALTTDITTPSLQQVTTEGNETTNIIRVVDAGESETNLEYLGVNFNDLSDGGSTYLQFQNTSIPNQVVEIRPLSGTMALLSDIPSSSGIPHATASGTDTYTATVTGVTAYTDADAYLIRFTNGNTTSPTLNINSLGAIPLYRNNDGPLLGGDILEGGEMLCIYNSTLNEFQVIGISPNSFIAYVTNDDSVTITKGMPVYAFSGQGDRMTVKRANNSADATSAQTVGLVLSTSIAAGQKGLIMMQGLLDGLSILPTATFADGDAVYLGATDGSITNVKPYAPNHLVYLGVVTTASSGSAGRMYVRIQNGYELKEIHDVDLISNAPTNNQALTYESSTDLWKNKTIIEDSITNGVTDKAPSQNAVFDALALKADAYQNYPFNTTTNYFGLFNIVPTISTSVIIGSTANNTNSAVAFNRFSVDKEITISDFAILQNGANDGASATVTLYIFDDTNEGLPGVKLHQETTATGILTVAQKYISFTNNITLQKGNYWVALHFRGLNTAGTNPSFIGGLINQPNVVTSIASYNINFRPLIVGATADLTNNPTITLGGFINFPQIFIKI